MLRFWARSHEVYKSTPEPLRYMTWKIQKQVFDTNSNVFVRLELSVILEYKEWSRPSVP